jgi:tRNA-dihydrouridine synthase A
LSPKENREAPPLRHDVVHALKSDFPRLTIVINGGIRSVADIGAQLARVDGVMIGREAYQNPYLLTEIDRAVFGGGAAPPRREVAERYLDYVAARLAEGVPLSRMTRHMLGLFQGRRGARRWRRRLSEDTHAPGAGVEAIHEALASIPEAEPGSSREMAGRRLGP